MRPMTDRPSCYPDPSSQLAAPGALPWLDVLQTPVPTGVFQSPVDHRHVLCLHLGKPVPVTWKDGRMERQGTRLHGQFCVVPAGSSTRWIVSQPATSLLLRLSPDVLAESGARRFEDLAPAIHIRDPHIERIGWMMQAEERDGYPGGRLYSDSLGTALAARLLALQQHDAPSDLRTPALASWRLRQVFDFVDAHLDQDLTLAELAAIAGYSVSHFKPMFRQAVGMPAHRFVMERRVERARALLKQGGMSSTDVALATGFTHGSHMARWLRRS